MSESIIKPKIIHINSVNKKIKKKNEVYVMLENSLNELSQIEHLIEENLNNDEKQESKT